MQSESKKTKQSNKPSSVSDLECQLVQKWAMLPTIVIEVKPKVLITNQTALDLTVKDIGTEFTWELGAGSTLTSPAVQVCHFCRSHLSGFADDATLRRLPHFRKIPSRGRT